MSRLSVKIYQIWSISDFQNCWEWQNSDQFMIETEALSSLSEDTILLIYQLSVFSKSEHWFIQIIISQSSKILQFIIMHYADSFSAWYSSSAELMICQERSVSLDSLDFQISWFLDDKRFKVSKAQTNLLTVITHLLDHSFYLDWQRSLFSLSSQVSFFSFFIISSISDEVEQENSDLTMKKKKIQMIERITAAVIIIMRIVNLTDTLITTLLTNTISSSAFKLEEIEYFDSELDIWYDEEDIVTVEKDSYIWDVHLFINQIKNAAAIKKADQVKIQLFRALKKIALK